MYTRCPSCRSEISFELPANLDTASLPDNYRHRIKCPCCGVTIGVKINRIDTSATYPNYNNYNNVQQPQSSPTAFEPVDESTEAFAPQTQTANKKSRSKTVTDKKTGVGRNVTVMIFSLLFIAVSVVGYLIQRGIMPTLPEWLSWLAPIRNYNGIGFFDSLINNFEGFKQSLAELGNPKLVALTVIRDLLPVLVFVFAGINFIVAFIAACGKKYARAWNAISGIIISICLIMFFLFPFIVQAVLASNTDFIGYCSDLITAKQYIVFAFVGLGILYFILSLCFCASMKKKQK